MDHMLPHPDLVKMHSLTASAKLPVSATMTSEILSDAASTSANRKSFRTWIGPAEMTRSPCFHKTIESPEIKIV